MLKEFSKPAACIILLLAFFYLFGYGNILRFLRGGVTVVKSKMFKHGVITFFSCKEAALEELNVCPKGS